MKKRCLISILSTVILFSCAPVLRHDLMQRGIFTVQLSEIKQNPAFYKGRLFILGGIIVNTTITGKGSLIEAIYVPVNSRGYLKDIVGSNGRFLALFAGKEILDPMIFREKREITLAGEFIETRQGKIGEMDYTYPFFEIKEIYLWEEKKDYYRSLDYPPWHYPYYPYWRYDPWWRYNYYYY